MKNLKSNPKALSQLKRKTLINQFILELVYHSEIKNISYKFTSSEILIVVNSVEHHFKINTPINLIRKYFLNLVLNNRKSFSKIETHSVESNQSYLFN